MFDPSTEDLWLEVKAAVEEARQHTHHAMDLIRRACGRYYRKDGPDQPADPENFGFAYQSNMLPVLAGDTPGVRVEAARVVGHKAIAQAMKDGQEAWIRDVDYRGAVEGAVNDMLFCRGVLLHYLEEDRRFSRGAVTPAVKRVGFDRFFQDALADGPDADAFRGHWYYADLDDLLADPDLKDEAREKLTPSEGEERERVFRKPSASSLGRRRVRCYAVWLRERNAIRVLCEAHEAVELYAPQEFYGPETGPYELFDAYPVPNQCWPLSPLIAINDQAVDLNVHARAMGRSAARRRSIGLVEASNPELGNVLADAEDGEIRPVRGISGQHVVIEVGGATKEQYTHTEYVRNRLDRISGLTATVQGAVGDADTATEAKIADDALSNRVGFLKSRVRHATERSLTKVGWYLFHTEGVVIPVNRRDAYTGEAVEGLFFGGPVSPDEQATWDDFALRIEANTLQKEQLAQQNLLRYYETFLQLMQAAPRMPWMRVMNVLRDLGDALDVGDKAEQWVLPEALGLMGQPQQAPPSQVLGGRETPPQRESFPALGVNPHEKGNAEPGGQPPDGERRGGTGRINTRGIASGPRTGAAGGDGAAAGFGGMG